MKRLFCTAAAFLFVWFVAIGSWMCSIHPFQRGEGMVALWVMGWIASVTFAFLTFYTWIYPDKIDDRRNP